MLAIYYNLNVIQHTSVFYIKASSLTAALITYFMHGAQKHKE